MGDLNDLNELIAGCAANDRLCQEKLYKKFYPALFSLCRKFFTDDHQALEVLNDGMLKVFKNIAHCDVSEPARFFNWMYTIVRNTALDKVRLAERPEHIEISASLYYEANESPLNKLEGKEIRKLLDGLPPATRVVCCLYYLDGYSINNISEILKLSHGTIKWHLSESRKRLQPVLENHFFKS